MLRLYSRLFDEKDAINALKGLDRQQAFRKHSQKGIFFRLCKDRLNWRLHRFNMEKRKATSIATIKALKGLI